MDARAAAVAAMVRIQGTDTTVGEALQRIADITQQAEPAADVVGMSMLGDDGRPTTAVFTDADSPEIDEAQYREGKGPCLDAWRDNTVLRVPQVEQCAGVCPAFAAACLSHGVHSTLSLPVRAGDVAVSGVDLYARVVDGFSADDESVATDLAAAGAAVLVNVSASWTAFDLSAQRDQAMQSRAVIEQATGLLMATQGCTSEQAEGLLRQAATHEARTILQIAHRIIEQHRTSG